MNQIRIGFVGNGWRVQQFLRIIQELPELFSLSGVLFRDSLKAELFEKEYSGRAFVSREKFIASKPDFVVVAVSRDGVRDNLNWLMDEQMPILCETPPADQVRGLIDLWNCCQKKHGRIQISEQYHLQPYLATVLKLVESGKIGRIESTFLSMMHDYHSISMMRKLLDTGFCNCKIEGRTFNLPVYQTCNRQGMTEPELVSDLQKLAVFRFDNETLGIHRFSGEQYFNYLRSTHLEVLGDAGEISDFSIRGLNEQDIPYVQQMYRVDAGPYNNLEGMFHHGMMVGEKMIYRNPFDTFTKARLTDDEIAMASMLIGMKEYVDTGKDIYSLADGLQDAYLWLMMDEAIRTSGTVYTEEMPWQVYYE